MMVLSILCSFVFSKVSGLILYKNILSKCCSNELAGLYSFYGFVSLMIGVGLGIFYKWSNLETIGFSLISSFLLYVLSLVIIASQPKEAKASIK